MTCANANITGGRIVLDSGTYNNFIIGDPDNIDADYTRMNGHAIEMHCQHTGTTLYIDPRNSNMWIANSDGRTSIYTTGITTPKVTQTSKAESKKNFEKFENGLDIIKSTDIYKYHLKSQEDTEKKEIGFVIGENYKYAHDITSVDKEGNEIGVDTYSMISVAYKAIQELAEQNEQLQKEIQEMKGEK